MRLFALAALIPLTFGCRDRAPQPAPSDDRSAAKPSAESPAPTPASAPKTASTTFERPDWTAIRAADDACADCHPDEADAWTRSPMGRSLGAASTAPSASADVIHPKTGERFSVRSDESGLLFEQAGGPTRAATHVIGSGSHTRSYLRLADGIAELMPITWYAAREGWDMSPGYHVPDHPSFFRQMNLECLTCHGAPVAVAGGTDDRFAEPLAGAIGCARCHGDGRAHVEGRLAGKPIGIVSPSKLDTARGADVCGQCHLQGAVRLTRAGRDWDHMMPGMALGDVVAVFVRSTPGSAFGIASHAERLGRSACAQTDPEARRCTTCHAPHPTGTRVDRSASCRGCHQAEKGHACAGAGGDDCAGCHMVQKQTADIPHVSMTDHFIRTRPQAEAQPIVDDGPLVWINRPADVSDAEARMMLGRAYAESARSRASFDDRDRALALLTPTADTRADDGEAWADLASMRRITGDPKGARAALEKAVTRPRPKARWWSALARLRLLAGEIDGAREALGKARALRPDAPEDHLTAARLALAGGDMSGLDAALARYETRLPGRAEPMLMRGTVAQTRFDPTGAEAAFADAVKREPGHALAWLSLCRIRVDLGRFEAADAACRAGRQLARGQAAVGRFAGARARVALGRGDAKIAAELAAAALDFAPADAALVLGRLALRAARTDDALKLLDRAVQVEPTLPDAWAALAEALRARGETALADRAETQARRLIGEGRRP